MIVSVSIGICRSSTNRKLRTDIGWHIARAIINPWILWWNLPVLGGTIGPVLGGGIGPVLGGGTIGPDLGGTIGPDLGGGVGPFGGCPFGGTGNFGGLRPPLSGALIMFFHVMLYDGMTSDTSCQTL